MEVSAGAVVVSIGQIAVEYRINSSGGLYQKQWIDEPIVVDD